MPLDSPSETPIARTSAATSGPTGALGDPGLWVDEHGDALFRYALSRLRDRGAAEDLVQETFLAALKDRERFRGASAPRTWLISVLRHKLVDHLRRSGRQQTVEHDEILASGVEAAFNARGRWIQRPGRWVAEAPTSTLERREFRQILDHCVEGVGGRAGEAFALRVLCDLPADEVCKVLEVKPTNLWVLLHRARNRLRSCMEKNWFGPSSRGESSC